MKNVVILTDIAYLLGYKMRATVVQITLLTAKGLPEHHAPDFECLLRATFFLFSSF